MLLHACHVYTFHTGLHSYKVNMHNTMRKKRSEKLATRTIYHWYYTWLYSISYYTITSHTHTRAVSTALTIHYFMPQVSLFLSQTSTTRTYFRNKTTHNCIYNCYQMLRRRYKYANANTRTVLRATRVRGMKPVLIRQSTIYFRLQKAMNIITHLASPFFIDFPESQQLYRWEAVHQGHNNSTHDA